MAGTKTVTSNSPTSTTDNEYRIGALNDRKVTEYFGNFNIDEMIFYANYYPLIILISSINWKWLS